MDHVRRVHRLFRGAAEIAKWLRAAALCCDLIATVISLYVLMAKPKDESAWLPLWILLLAIVAVALRAASSGADGFAQRCRRISLRAFSGGKDVDQLTVSLLDDDSFPCVEWTASKLPAQSIEEYYEPTTPPGPVRSGSRNSMLTARSTLGGYSVFRGISS